MSRKAKSPPSPRSSEAAPPGPVRVPVPARAPARARAPAPAADSETLEDSYTIDLDDAALPGAVADVIDDSDDFDFDARARTAPDRPGVYIMRDRAGAICYIGKAASLRARLKQYASGQDNRFFVHLLHEVLGGVDLVLTASEKDALLLENDLVKQHQPRFNVKLKDDKRFLH